MSEEQDRKGAREKVSDGIKQGIGVLSAFKDALEETIQEARERGDLSADRAKDVMKSALDKAQEAAGTARERLDFVTQNEFHDVVDGIKSRIGDLESKVFGAPRAEAQADAEPAEGSEEGEAEGVGGES